MTLFWNVLLVCAAVYTLQYCTWRRCLLAAYLLVQIAEIPILHALDGSWDVWYTAWLVNIPLEIVAIGGVLNCARFDSAALTMAVHVAMKLKLHGIVDCEYQFAEHMQMLALIRWANRIVILSLLYCCSRKEPNDELGRSDKDACAAA